MGIGGQKEREGEKERRREGEREGERHKHTHTHSPVKCRTEEAHLQSIITCAAPGASGV